MHESALKAVRKMLCFQDKRLHVEHTHCYGVIVHFLGVQEGIFLC